MGLFDFLKRDEKKRKRGQLMPGVRGVGTFQPSLIATMDSDSDGIPDDEDADPYRAEDETPDFLVDRVNAANSEDPFDEDPEEEDTKDAVELFKNPLQFQFETRDMAFRNTAGDMSEHDMVLRYQANPTPENLEPLLAANQQGLRKAINNLSAMRVPKPAIEGEVYTRFAQQAKAWDPSRGSSLLHSFTQNKGRTLSRDMRQLAQFGKAERSRVSKMDRIHSVQELIELSGEEATAEKISAETGFSLSDVQKALVESAGDLLGSKDMGIGDTGSDEVKIRMAASRIKDFYSGASRSLVEHMFGLTGNPPILDNNELARLTSVSPTYVSRFKKQVTERLQAEYQRM